MDHKLLLLVGGMKVIPFPSLVVEEVLGVVPIVHSWSCVVARLLCQHEGDPQVLFP